MNSALQCSQLEEAEKATIYFCNDAALINCYVFNSTRVLKIELGASLLAARGVEEARESQLQRKKKIKEMVARSGKKLGKR